MEWKAIKDCGLPKEYYEEYFITIKVIDKNTKEVSYEVDSAVFVLKSEGYICDYWNTWNDWDEGCEDFEVIAYMKMPEPYIEGE